MGPWIPLFVPERNKNVDILSQAITIKILLFIIILFIKFLPGLNMDDAIIACSFPPLVAVEPYSLYFLEKCDEPGDASWYFV